MTELSPNEKDLLQRISKKPELEPLFFRKVKGLKWFDAFSEKGYFNAENIPKLVQSEQEGYLIIPPWKIGEYLVKTTPELTDEKNSDYATRFLRIISDATEYAKKHGFGNYRVWSQFAEIVSQIPSRFIQEKFIEDTVDYWLEDKFEKNLISELIAEKWFAELLREETEDAFRLALRLLGTLYKVKIEEQEPGQKKMLFRSGNDEVNRITDKIAFLSGKRLGIRSVSVLHSTLEKTLRVLNNDSRSYSWQRSIKKSETEKHFFNPGNILIKAYRECLNGCFESHPEEARDHVGEMIGSSFETVQRLAIHFITNEFSPCREYAGKLIDEKFFGENYRNEFWYFLNQNYGRLTRKQKSEIAELIKKREVFDLRDRRLEPSTAYEQAFWLSAIKDYDAQMEDLYEKTVSIAGVEPRSPDSPRVGRVKVGWLTDEYQHLTDKLQGLQPKELAQRLHTTDIQPARAIKPLIKASPLIYYAELMEFKYLGFDYQSAVTGAYCDLWKEKSPLPWDDIWPFLLQFFSEVVESDRFKKNTSAERSELIRTIAELLESGARSDEHAFDKKHHDDVEFILERLLENEKGVKFKETQDKVTTAINSPRGVCIQALINLTLRSCRLSHRENKDDHSSAWKKFQPYYDAELERADSNEFFTLVTVYLRNFLYMSGEWVLSNLDTIFDKENYMGWLCAMEGYYYAEALDEKIYNHLSKNGDLLKALEDQNVPRQVKNRIIENIALAYIHDLETLKNDKSMIKKILIDRKICWELDILIDVVTSSQEKSGGRMKNKIYELWPLLVDAADFSTREGKALASSLCRWSAFVDYLDEEKMKLLLKIAPYADASYTPSDLLENLARLSNKQPFEANKIWLKVLDNAAPTYPEEAIRKILSNLVSQGEQGKRTAEKTVEKYVRLGAASPVKLLREIINDA